MKVSVLSLVLAVVLSATTLCYAYPEPAILAGLSDWTLEVAFDQPQQITVKLPTDPADAPAKRFWYTIISLTNNSRQIDVPFYPDCELMTDTFQIVQAPKDSTRPVFEKIKLRHQGQYPFLEPIEFVGNKVLQGFDNTVDLAIIWPDFDEKAKNVSLFIAGLSNETVVLDHPSGLVPGEAAQRAGQHERLSRNGRAGWGGGRRALASDT